MMETKHKVNITLLFAILFLLIVNLNAQENGQWNILNEGGSFRTMDFINDQVGWIAGEGTLLKTEDGGVNWYSLYIHKNWEINKIDFINESIGWGIGSYHDEIEDTWKDIITKSKDGGQTWVIQKELPNLTYLTDILHNL